MNKLNKAFNQQTNQKLIFRLTCSKINKIKINLRIIWNKKHKCYKNKTKLIIKFKIIKLKKLSRKKFKRNFCNKKLLK